MTTNNTAIEALGTKAANMAITASVRWLQTQGWTIDQIRAKAAYLSVALKSVVHAALDVAMNDAREAMACGMVDAAQATFAATMAIAGIDAAKQFVTEAR
jgi:hypothetical protein